ncbi:MAG TPA: pitrilysin family protein [Longimicrobiaceae bacterium]|nr:pitrilysin family protein [Longimicrobiaceae bacterium]
MRAFLLIAIPFAAACASAPAVPDTPAPAAPQQPMPSAGAENDLADFPSNPPPPLPAQPLEFPGFRETTLPNGLQLIIVEQHDQPIANLSLYIESGAANDPPPEAGLANIVAQMLTKGTADRTAEEISQTIEGVGGDLTASAADDYIRVSAVVLADDLPLAFELVQGVTLEPTFPQDELDIVRTRMLSALQAELAQPASVAQRRFVLEVYGAGHPYSLAALPGTVSEIDKADLEEFHDAHFSADNAVLVVSGDVDADEVEELASNAFGEWAGGGVPEPTFIEPPAREAARIYFVHRPGSVQSNILVGHVGIRPENPDYYPLQVLNKIVGGGTDSRLFSILREEKGWTYGAYSRLSRPEEIGYFVASAEVRNAVTDSALIEMLNQLNRIRDETVTAAELNAAKSFLTGSFPLRIETAGQIAAQIAQVRLLGLPVDALTQYRERIEMVSAADVQRVAREYIRPERAVIVVVGDATQVLEDLEGIAPIEMYSVEGDPLEMADLEITAPTVDVDAAALEPAMLTYQLMVQGNPLGTATITLAREGDNWLSTTTMGGAMNQQSEVRFTSELEPISAMQSLSQGAVTITSDLAYADGRVTGTVELPPQMGGAKDVDAEVVPGTLLPEMEGWYLAAAELAPGKAITIPQFNAQSGTVAGVTYTVTGTETLTTPAGTFETFRVEVSGVPQQAILYLRQDSPHITVRQEFVGQPVVLELQEVAR